VTIQIEPHYRLQILPNVGGVVKEDSLEVYAELRGTGTDTISAANLVVVAYREDGTLCGVEESLSYLTLRAGECKAVKVRLEVEPAIIAGLRLYAETEFDEDDPCVTDPALAEPPRFMSEYFQRKPGAGPA
jgi:hypothetical protein